MLIQTSTKISKVNSKLVPAIGTFVISDDHHIALTGELSKALGLTAASAVKVAPDVTLTPITGDDKKITAEQKLKIQDAVVTFGASVLPLLKKYHPEILGPADGIEFIFATKKAFDAFTDSENKSVIKPVIKTTRALMELIDIITPVFPQIKNIPYLETVGVIIKVGDSVWQIYSDVSKATSGITK